MDKSNLTHPLLRNVVEQDQCQGTVFAVLNGDSNLFEPIREVLTNAGFGIARVEDQWFQHFWKIQRQLDATQPHNPTAPIPSSIRPTTSLKGLVEMFKAQWNHLAPATRIKLDCHFKVAARYLNFDRDVAGICLADMRELKSKLSEKRKSATVNDIIFKALAALFALALEDGRSTTIKIPHWRQE
jgi:hypothetical protein